MNDEAVEVICKKLIGTRTKSQGRKRYGVFVFDGKDADSDVARRLERDVFLEYFGNDEHVFAQEYGPYDGTSELIVVIDQRLYIPVGMARLIRHGKIGIKTLNDIVDPRSPWGLTIEKLKDSHNFDLLTTWDIATIAVRRRYRTKYHRRLIRATLFYSIYQHAKHNETVHWVAILDDVHLNNFIKMGIPIKSIASASSKPYLGSPASTPVVITVNDVANSIRSKSIFNHALLVDGKILQRIVSF